MKRIVTIALAASLVVALPGVALAAAEQFAATLSGDQENPPVTTSASGSAKVTISDDEASITYEVTYSGLSGDLAASHIHLGAVGENGGIMLPLAAGPSPMSGTLTSADFMATGDVTSYEGALDAIRDGRTYVNLHTAANPGGEIRGQLKTILNTATEDPISPPAYAGLLLVLAFAVAALVAWKRPFARVR